MLRILFRNLLCTLKVGFRKKFIFMMLVPLVYLPTLAYASFQDAVDIEITKVEYHDFYERFVVVGQSRAENSKTYYAKTAGTIDSIAITQGQEVKKGDVLLTIDLEIAEATKTKAEASFESAKSTYDRDFSLWKKKIISKEVLDKSKVALETAKADLATENEKYQNMIIKAPFDGSIGVVPTQVGNDTKVGDYLFTIIAVGEKIIFVELPESLNGKINKNSDVSVRDLTGNKVLGKVTAISNYLNDNGTITAKLSFPPNTKILHGSYVETEIIFDRHEGLALPEKVVLKNNKGNFVYKIDKDNKVKQIYIITKTRSDDLIEISSEELQVGDPIVLEGLTKIYDGALVRLIEKAPQNQGKEQVK
jgi:RND family efflux transporter MFP subunit